MLFTEVMIISSVSDMWNGYVVGIVLIVVGIVIAFGVGMTNDVVIDAFDDAGVYDDTPEEWQDIQDSTTSTAIDLLYVVPYLSILSGLLIIGLSVFRSRWNRQY